MNPPSDKQSVDILLIEDDPSDQKLVKRFFDDSMIRNKIYTVDDGEEALNYLHEREQYGDDNAPRPDLILLDLNLPKVDGRDVLEEMNQDEVLREIPVVVLTTSEEEEDVHRSYGLGASSYIVKPMNMEQFKETIKKLKDYWFDVVVLPTEEDDIQ
jgi:CheY-like chemotaxis protein